MAEKRALLEALLVEKATRERADTQPGTQRHPLSHGQRALWLLSQLAPESAGYNVYLAVETPRGFELDQLKNALAALLARHPMLRSSFVGVEGEPWRVVHPTVELCWSETDASTWEHSELREHVRAFVHRPFDLREPGLLRVHVYPRASGKHVVALVVHHIVVDYWSFAVLMSELRVLFEVLSVDRTAALPLARFEYSDYVRWQAQLVGSARGEELFRFWSKRLERAIPPLALTPDRPRPLLQSSRGAVHSFWLSEATSRGVKDVAKRNGVTPFTVLLCAYQCWLHRCTGQDTVRIGTPVSGRTRPEFAELVGYFVNLVVVESRLGTSSTFAEQLAQTKLQVLGALEHQDYPFSLLVERLQPERDISRAPLVQAAFALQGSVGEGAPAILSFADETAAASLRLGRHDLTSFAVEHDRTQFELMLMLEEAQGRYFGVFEYCRDLFDADSVARMAEHFTHLLEACLREGGATAPVAQLDLMSTGERALVVEGWNANARPYPVTTLAELLEQQARRTPDAVALVFGGLELSYADLEQRTLRVAHLLRRRGVRPDVCVGVYLERSIELVVALLAILRAGGAYVPLDPEHPAERTRATLESAGIGLVITTAALAPDATEAGARSLWLADGGEEDPSSTPGAPGSVLSALAPQNLAYVIHTSGTTGQPKGVAISHGAIVNRLLWMQEEYRLQRGDRVLQKTPFTFDVSVWEFFWPLITGATLVVAEPGVHRDPRQLARVIVEQRIDTLHFVPSMLQVFLEVGASPPPRCVRRLFASGEALPPELVERCFEVFGAAIELHNLYGPTEAAVDVSHHRCARKQLNGSVPIGRPIANVSLYVLDARFEPSPVGVPGELYIGGVALARGYIGRPDLTAERFLPDPLGTQPGARLYHTGDRARFRADGSLEFLGRSDPELKIRGFRIDPREVEAHLQGNPNVVESAVAAVGENAARRLVGYVVLREGSDTASLSRYLGARLPAYMVPSSWVLLVELPKTASGKLDRPRLPAPSQSTAALVTAPRTDTEARVAAIWRELMRLETVGVHDDFFELGGHSLLAARIAARLERDFGAALSLRALFEARTIAALAAAVEGARAAGTGATPSLVHLGPAGRYGPSAAQRSLWFAAKLAPASPAYNIPVALAVTGPLDLVLLERALNRVIERHESLRTVFDELDGEPSARVVRDCRLDIEFIDVASNTRDADAALAKALALTRTLAARPFDLSEAPLVRVTAIRVDEQTHVLSVIVHHVAADGWSMGILLAEVGTLYRALRRGALPELQPLTVTYADYAAWQRRLLEGEGAQRSLEYWRRELAVVPALELQTDFPRPAVLGWSGARVRLELSEATTSRLKRLAATNAATPFACLLAAFQLLLCRSTGQQDFVVGTPVSGRSNAELEPLIGLFLNTLGLRARVGEALRRGIGFSQWIRDVQAGVLEAFAQQALPFETLVGAVETRRAPRRTPLFQVLFVYQNAPFDGASIDEDLELRLLDADPATAKFELTLDLRESAGKIGGHLEFSTELFHRSSIERLAERYVALVSSLVSEPERPLTGASIVSRAELSLTTRTWNATEAPVELPATIHERFARAVEAHPNRTALAWDGRTLDYAGLDARAARIASWLAARGVVAEARVAVYLERDFDLVATLLGVLKSGACYVPLDPEQPAARVGRILDDARPAVLVTRRNLLGRLAGAPVTLVLDEPGVFDDVDSRFVSAVVRPEQLAYILHTSGSTGQPKGVQVTHEAVANLLSAMGACLDLRDDDAWLATTTLAFDIAALELFLPLTRGARVLLAPAEVSRDGRQLVDAIQRLRPTIMQATPAGFQMLLDAGFGASPGLRVLCGGEALPEGLAHRLRARTEALFNVYGPTETTIWSTLQRVDDAHTRIPIGRPLANTQIYILDRWLSPVAVGAPGELYIGGVGLARGYHALPERTAERFVPNPFGAPGSRLFATGDRARYLEHGAIEFLGRVDGQVKIRGFRVELGEVEAALHAHPEIENAVSVARGEGLQRRIIAYVVPRAGLFDRAALQRFLAERLPGYMLPSALVVLERLPLGPHGKVDREALPDAPPSNQVLSDPETPTQRELLQLWSEVLELEQPGLHDDFFAVGGQSLLAARLMARVSERFGIELPLRRIFEAPTVVELAAVIDAARADPNMVGTAPLSVASRSGELPLSFAQERLWFLSQLVPDSPYYNMPFGIWLRGIFQSELLSASFADLVARHETLRTRFVSEHGRPRQVIEQSVSSSMAETWLTDQSPECAREAALNLARGEARRPFDLSRAPLFRVCLFRTGRDEALLVVVLHHTVSDGWSMGVIATELSAAYAARTRRESSPLPALPFQYLDYAVWQRSWLSGDVLEAQLRYWIAQLSGDAPPLRLPLDRPRPALPTFSGRRRPYALPRELTRELVELGRERGATLFMTLLAAYQLLLARVSGQDDIRVGSPIANRRRPELEPLIGFFVNTLVHRTRFAHIGDGDPSFIELLAQVRDTVLEAFAHQDLPFERLVEALQPSRNLQISPLFQAAFVLQNAPLPRIELGQLELEVTDLDNGTAKFDLTLCLIEVAGELRGYFEFSSDLFDEGTIARLGDQFETLLRSVVSSPGARISSFSLADGVGTHLRPRAVLEQAPFGSSASRVSVVGGLLHEHFEARVREQPEAIALRFQGEALTYRQLDARAERIARALLRIELGQNPLIGVCIDHGPDLIAAILGVLKAGGAYLPLDPGHPRSRLHATLKDARAAAVLVTRELFQVLESSGHTLLDVDAVREESAGEQAPSVWPRTQPGDLAYVIYTSGSTGDAKGVMVTHENVVRLFSSTEDRFCFGPEDVFTLFHSASFDFSVWEIFGALLYGGRLVIPPRAVTRAPEQFLDLLVGERVTILNQTPSAFRQLSQADAERNGCLRGGALRCVVFGGEALDLSSLGSWFERYGDEHPALVNMYGITETTVHVTWRRIRIVDVSTAPGSLIGSAIPDLTVHVLDRALRELPVSVPGELFVSGRGLARGYLHGPALTAERFVPAPEGELGARIYRTGDLARRLPNGDIEYLGRVDHQVKIRGFRIELGEIESVLRQHRAVADAVVVTRNDAPLGLRLVAYVVTSAAFEAEGREALELELELVKTWKALYEDTYALPGGAPDATLDTTGWKSSYTGQEIAESDMRDWRDRTVERLEEIGGSHVWELGCGTGMLLLCLAKEKSLYFGTDLSATALASLSRVANRMSLDQVRLEERAAHDFAGIAPNSFDLVVLNSVIQYFPSIAYLRRVLAQVGRALMPGGTVFIGDVRSLSLLAAFHCSVLVEQNRAMSRSRLREAVAQAARADEELVVDPDFFHALCRDIAELEHAEIWIKRGAESSEMARFRYDVALYKAPIGEFVEPEQSGTWSPHSGLAGLEADLREASARGATIVEVLAIPNGRVIEAVCAMRSSGEGSPRGTAPDPEQLFVLGQRLGYRIRVRPSRGGAPELVDALFEYGTHVGRPRPWRPAGTLPASVSRAHANFPLRSRLSRFLIPTLRANLLERLPEYMVPGSFVVLESLPLTTNGKLDRAALPPPDDLRPELETPFAAPRTPEEVMLADLFGELLGVRSIGIHDDFFALGGHSLLATQLASRIRALFAVALPLHAIFERPTIAALVPLLAEASGANPRVAPIAPTTGLGPVPLSFAQERMHFLHRLDPQAAAYNIVAALELKGELDVRAFSAALAGLIERHGVLRTRFEEGAGTASAIVEASAEPEFVRVALGDVAPEALRAEAELVAAREARRPIDISRAPPLRVLLLSGRESAALVFAIHHIAADGWSMGVLLSDLAELYRAALERRAPALPALGVQYADFAAWQRSHWTDAAIEPLLQYWVERLRNLPPEIDLPFDRRRPRVQTFDGREFSVTLPAELSRELGDMARRENVTLYMLLIAAFALLLKRYTGQEDIAIGTPIASRDRLETERLVGFFVNTLVLRFDLSNRPSVRQLLDRVRQTTLEAYTHQDLPFERLVQRLQPTRDLGRTPLFQVMFILQNTPLEVPAMPGVQVSPLDVHSGFAKFDLTLEVRERPEGLKLKFEYATGLFDRGTIERFAAHYGALLGEMLNAPDADAGELRLRAEEEARWLVLEGARQVRVGSVDTLHGAFEMQAGRTPHAVALWHRERSMTYAELDRRATALAHELLLRGLELESRVAVMLPRTPELLVSILAVLKAGAAYVPVDPTYPSERLEHMLRDSGAALLLTNSGAAEALSCGVPALCIDQLQGSVTQEDPRLPKVRASNLAYVIYTSGSTGKPKGVAIAHESAVAMVRWARSVYDSPVLEGVLASTSVCFDLSVFELFVPLASGGGVVLVDNLLDLMSGEARPPITLINTVPSAMQELLRAGLVPSSTTVVNLAGEPLRRSLVEGLYALPHVTAVYNLYGPSEDTTYSTFVRVPAAEDKEPTIGVPVANTRAYVLDGNLALVPEGVAGELFLGGDKLARGYIGAPDLTATRFVPDPFTTDAGARLYRTGDRVRLRNGELEFLGRLDHQVKIRGFRVEVGEVENVLLRHPAIQETCVVARRRTNAPSGALRLVAYLVAPEPSRPSEHELRQLIRTSLPEPFVPAVFCYVEALPRTPNGKLDRKALPEPENDRGAAAAAYVAPQSEIERELAELWSELLGVQRVGLDDDFFELGGHSLLAMQGHASIQSRFGVELPLAELFTAPTVRLLAQSLEEKLLSGADEETLDALLASGDATPFGGPGPVDGASGSHADTGA